MLNVLGFCDNKFILFRSFFDFGVLNCWWDFVWFEWDCICEMYGKFGYLSLRYFSFSSNRFDMEIVLKWNWCIFVIFFIFLNELYVNNKIFLIFFVWVYMFLL